MSTNLCQACGARGYTVPIEVLRGLLCLPCVEDFQAWWDTRPSKVACLPTDWPGWVRGRPEHLAAAAQRARDLARDERDAVGTRPLNPATRALLGAWHQYRKQVA